MKRKVNDAYVRSKTRLDKITNKLNSLGISYNVKESGPWHAFKVAGDDKAYNVYIRGKVDGYVTINTDKEGSIAVRLNANSGKLLVDKLCSTVEQAISEIVNALSLVTDSITKNSIKSYKIKNHDSGKTYLVKAVSYTDAKMKYNKYILKDADKSMGTYNGYTIKQNVDGDIYVLKKSGEKEFFESWKKAYEAIKSGAIKDSITEDALSKFVQSYLSTKKVSSKAEQDEIIKFLLERNKITTEDIPKVRSLLKIVKDALTEDVDKDSLTEDDDTFIKETIAELLRYIRNWDFMSAKERNNIMPGYSKSEGLAALKTKLNEAKRRLKKDDEIKDSFTEDADIVYKGYQILANYQLGSKNIANYKIYEPNGDYLFSVKTVEQAKKVIDNEVKSQINDADIAQTDIKSTYLPEDANADNIQYLGFNEKRKLSFYSYGDRYFVHYDLEGRTEEIDKATVQKILKKNILGEIDENDLINKEPQSEEIVSDAFDWKTKQERGDR